MSALDLLQGLSQAVWMVLSVLTAARAIRRRSHTAVDTALFFGSLGLVVVYSRLSALLDLPAQPRVGFAAVVFLLTTPYLLLRLVRDFGGVRWWVMRAAEAGFVASAIAAVPISFDPVAPGTPPDASRAAATLLIVVYFAVVSVYAAVRSAQLAGVSYGMTKQRMQAVALGSYLLGVTLLLAGIGAIAVGLAGVTGGLSQICFLASGLAYAVGLAPPAALKQYWQLPELRSFIARSSILPRSTLAEIVDELAAMTGRALGARATIGLWDEDGGVMRFRDPHGALPAEMGPSDFLAWRSFSSQLPLYVPDVAKANPTNAARYKAANVGPVLIAPITAGERRIGVIEVYAPREPIFAEDDLAFVELIAQQASVLIESRQLIDAAAAVRAQEEATRLKEDFVSAAAHDLKTPLTTIVAQAQLLERRAEREGRVAELTGIRRLSRETAQLSRLVEELLDASRIDRGAFPLQPARADLVAIAREVVGRERSGSARVELEADASVGGTFDPERVRQLLDNLVENALKYSPAESTVTVKVWRDGPEARVAVMDRGIGIPAEDVPHVFDRFRRGSNVDHRSAPGIGLGLYICRGIVDQHGGKIWVESAPGRGTTFHVALPLVEASERPRIDAHVAAS